jgi:cold shock CspA family protein/ribosome-associated translation inhibitor RaiA
MDALGIVFRNMDASEAVEARIREHVARLERLYGRIAAGKVVVEAPHRRGRQGRLYRVKLRLATPRREVVVSHEGPMNHAHEDVYVAVRDAFDAAERRLQSHAAQMRGEVKAHEAPQLEGRVARLFPDHGFIAAQDGSEVYFHANAVVGNRFARLAEGDRVRLVVAEGEGARGPQASTVLPRRRRAAAPGGQAEG